MSVAKVIEISSTSAKSFEDAIQQGITRANKTLKNVEGAWIKEQKVMVKDGAAMERLAEADAAVFDRDYNSRRLHAGAGAGFIIDLPDNTLGSRSAVFVRAEMPFFAAGGNRFQIFTGINGQVF